MKTLQVIWLTLNPDTPARGYWDQGMIEDLFANKLWSPVMGYKFDHRTKQTADFSEGGIVVIPARSHVKYADVINALIHSMPWVIVMLTGDEEASFPFKVLQHSNMRLWVMSPRPGYEYPAGTRYLGTGYPPKAREVFASERYHKKRALNLFFAGQITHRRRQEMAAAFNELIKVQEEREAAGEQSIDIFYEATSGFTQGMPQPQYYDFMAQSEVVACPSGPETPDTFRLFEALEASAIPIADAHDPKGIFPANYWTWFFGEEPPFPVLTNYEQLNGYTQELVDGWYGKAAKVSAWWIGKKRQMAYNLTEDLAELGVSPKDGTNRTMLDHITVLIPSSPIADHPSTAMLEKTIADVRAKLPDSEIIIMLDGVRPEQEHYRERYDQYKNRVMWLALHTWHNVLPVVFDQHTHQASMTREALKLVKTPTILFVEHDAPITPDRTFEWQALVAAIQQGDANVIRFHHEALVLPEHEHLMLGKVEFVQRNTWSSGEVDGAYMRRTMQWSQRPHLASTAFYKLMLDTYFNPESRTMIEDVMHGIVQQICMDYGIQGWYQFRLWMYHPIDEDIKRSYHLDGRGADPKYDMDIKPVERPL